jgi:hypothetical protein
VGRAAARVHSQADAPNPRGTVLMLLSALSSLLLLTGGLVALRPKPAKVRNDQFRVDDIEARMKEGRDLVRLWNLAERGGDDAQRRLCMKQAQRCFAEVIDMVEALRVAPYVDPKSQEGEFLKGYVFLEQFSSEAGIVLLDIVKRSRVDD